MSKFADGVHDTLKRLFPHFSIVREHYVSYKNTRLYFDFYVKELNLFFEVQGGQHFKFNKHFHGDRDGYLRSKRRDNLKKEWIEKKEHHLIEIFPNDKISENMIMNKIYKALGYKINVKRRKRKPRNRSKRKAPKRT